MGQPWPIPFTSSSFVFGLATRRMYSFSSCQRFSMGLIHVLIMLQLYASEENAVNLKNILVIYAF